MMKEDFIYLNVQGHLNHYKNPPTYWRKHVLQWTGALLDFLEKNDLIISDVLSRHDKDQLILRMSDLDPLARSFIMDQQVERWLTTESRRKTKDIEYDFDVEKLQRRWDKYKSTHTA